MTLARAALCLIFACVLAACDGGSGATTAPTAPAVGEVNCKSKNQNQVGNTTVNNVVVDCGDATAEPFVVPAE